MSKNRTFLIIGLLVLLFVGITTAAWFLLRGTSSTIPTVQQFYSTLTAENTAFAQAEAIRSRGGGAAEALPLYKEALKSARTPAEEGQIKLLIAMMTGQLSQGTASIPLFKEVAADTRYPTRVRAFATQEMALALNSTGSNKVWHAIFDEEPYKGLVDPKDNSITNRHLFEYAASIYPLAVSEIAVADWYANRLVVSAKATTTSMRLSDATVASYKDIIRQNLALADADIERSRTSPLGESNVPLALLRRAVLVGKLQITGDSSFGNAEEAFLAAEQEYAKRGWSSGFVFFNHATFLVHYYGAARASDIRELLKPVTASQVFDSKKFARYLKNIRVAAPIPRTDAVRLARIDSEFKSYLISLGWAEADFR